MAKQPSQTIDYYVWLMSDWAYLGGARFVQMAARHGVRINHIPMRMQDVYAGSGGVLLAQRSWQRRAYRILELKRWRARLGMCLNIEPKFFPVDVDLASCMVIAGQRRHLPVADLVNAIMRAIWAEDQDVSDPGVLITIAERHGLDGAGLLEAARADAVRAEYQDNTARALAAGVFGSPFYAFAGELFWGQDRLDMLEETIVRSATRDLGRSSEATNAPGRHVSMEATMAVTKRAIPRFRVAEHAEGDPWIVIEQSGGEDLSLLKNMIGFNLRPGTTLEEANTISKYLNLNIQKISETVLS
jgi:2-hydroxychromene-2-carboxylate isomerase